MKMMSRWLVVCFVLVGMSGIGFAQIAEDTADNYGGVWGDGTSEGSGFGPWQFTTNNDGETLYAGGFLGDPDAAGIVMDDPAFGLYANPVGAFISIEREFRDKDGFGDTTEDIRPLELGNVFSLEWGVNWDAQDGNKGFSLFADTNELVNVNMGGFPGDITVNGVDTGIGYGVFPMRWSFTMAGPNSLLVEATARSNYLQQAFSTTIPIVGAPDRFRIYAADMTSEATRQPYFNNFEILEGLPPELFFISGATGISELGEYDYDLGRLTGGAVDDDILLSSSNTDVLTVPAMVSFDPLEDELTFSATVVSVTEGSAVITASNTASGAVATFDVAIIAPTLSISGPGAIILGESVQYTVTRAGPVNDAITVSSSDASVADLPETAISFDPEATTTTFMVDAEDVGQADLEVTDGVTTSAPFTVTVVQLPDPPAGIYDDGTFYPTGWEDGMNRGNGFGPWSFNISQDPPNSYAGVFIGDSANTGITGMAERVFGFYANPPESGANAEVNRDLADALEPGEVFRFLWGLNWDSDTEGSNRGFVLRAGETEIVNLNMANSAFITVNGNTMFTEYGNNAMLIQIQYVTDGLVRVWATGRDGVESYDELLSVPAGAPDNFRFYFNATTSEDQRQMYFDQLEVVEGDPVNALIISGPTSVTTADAPEYTVTRFGAVGDIVDLASSDAAVLAVPASIIFPAESDTQTFIATVVGVGQADLTAENVDAASAPLTVTVTEAPEPPEGIYDDATYYDGSWNGDDNGGNGFEPWVITATDGGTFIGDASEQGPNNAAINTDGVAFGMWTMGGDDPRSVDAIRSFTAPLSVGDVFTFQLAFRWDNGTRGFVLEDANDEVFYFGIDGGGYFWSDEGSADATPWQDLDNNPIRENGVVLDVEITQLDGDVAVLVSSAQDPALSAGGIFPSGALTTFKLYLSNAGGDTDGNFYANRFEVVQGDPPGPVGPGFDDLVLDIGTGDLSFTIPDGYALVAVEAADLVLVDGDFDWVELTEGVDYTVDAGVVTGSIIDSDGAIIRIRLLADIP